MKSHRFVIAALLVVLLTAAAATYKYGPGYPRGRGLVETTIYAE